MKDYRKMDAWIKLEREHLNKHPICVICAENGEISGAEYVVHIIDHEYNPELFFEPKNLQSVCSQCKNDRDEGEKTDTEKSIS